MEPEEYFCPVCGWKGDETEIDYDDEMDTDICPKCGNLVKEV